MLGIAFGRRFIWRGGQAAAETDEGEAMMNETELTWASLLFLGLIAVVWVIREVRQRKTKLSELEIRHLELMNRKSQNQLNSNATGLALHLVGHQKYDFYEILGLSATATFDDIEAAHKAKLAEYNNLALGARRDTTNTTRIINIVHSVLSKPASRSAYDEKLRDLQRVSKLQYSEYMEQKRSLESRWFLIKPFIFVAVAVFLVVNMFSQSKQKSSKNSETAASHPSTVVSSTKLSDISAEEERTKNEAELQGERLKATEQTPQKPTVQTQIDHRNFEAQVADAERRDRLERRKSINLEIAEMKNSIPDFDSTYRAPAGCQSDDPPMSQVLACGRARADAKRAHDQRYAAARIKLQELELERQIIEASQPAPRRRVPKYLE